MENIEAFAVVFAKTMGLNGFAVYGRTICFIRIPSVVRELVVQFLHVLVTRDQGGEPVCGGSGLSADGGGWGVARVHSGSFGPALLSGMPLALAHVGGPGTRDGPAWVGRLSVDSYR